MSDKIPVAFRYAGHSSDRRANRWEVDCGKCKKPFSPPTTMLSRQDFDCPRCGALHTANWNQDSVHYLPSEV